MDDFDDETLEEHESKEINTEEISSEADRMLKSMTKEEIIQAQQELLNSLNPSLIEKLKKSGISKKKPKKDLEEEKLAWMKPISKPTKNSSTVRYDFDGKVVLDDNIPVHSGLYHHGEEPDKPGYTIDEIFHLIHSTVTSQKILCLKILGNIIKNDPNMKDELFDMDIGSLLFLCIDDKNPNIISHGLSILYLLAQQQKQEKPVEIFMVALINARNLKPEKEVEEDFKDICKTDILGGFLKFDLLDRISYFLNENILKDEVLKLLKLIVKTKPNIEEKFINCYKLINGIELQLKKDDELLQLYQALLLNFRSRENVLKFLKMTNLDKKCLENLSGSVEYLKMMNILIEKGFCFDLIKEYFSLILNEILLKQGIEERISLLFSLLNSYIEYVSKDEKHSFYHLNSFFESDLVIYLKNCKTKNLLFYASVFHCLSNFYIYLPTQLEYSTNSFVHVKKFDENLKDFYMNFMKELVDSVSDQKDIGLNELNYFKFSLLLFFKKVNLQDVDLLKFLKSVEIFKDKNLPFNNFNFQFGLLLLKYCKDETYLKINLIKLCSMNHQNDEQNFKMILKDFKFSKPLEMFFLTKYKENKDEFTTIDWYYSYLEKYYTDQTISISMIQLKEFLEFLLSFEKEDNMFIPNHIRLSNILKVFFLKNEVYQDAEIENLLNEFFNLFLGMKFNEGIDHERFFSFVEQFVNLYTFSSFGNAVFTKYLFLFFQIENFQNSIYRKFILKSLKGQLFLLSDLKLLTNGEAVENDVEIIHVYIENISNIDSESNFYHYCIHQIHGYIFKYQSYFLFDEIFEFITDQNILIDIFRVKGEHEKDVLDKLSKMDGRIQKLKTGGE